MSNGNYERNTLRDAPRWVHGFSWSITGVFTLILVVLHLIYFNLSKFGPGNVAYAGLIGVQVS